LFSEIFPKAKCLVQEQFQKAEPSADITILLSSTLSILDGH
jgi:hypothetical protein